MKLKCPICGEPVDSGTGADFPFCNERCRIQDLGNWSAEKYVVSQPAFDEEEPEDARSENADSRRKREAQSDEDEPNEV